MLSYLFKNKVADSAKLIAYGFKELGGKYVYSEEILEGQFKITVTVENGETCAKITDSALGDEYTLHLVADASGEFVGRVRAEYDRVLSDIAAKCFDSDVFKNQSREISDYAKLTYGDELEFLWADLPDAAVLRRKDSSKWYALFMKIPPRRLELEGEDLIDILDVRCDFSEIEKKRDGKNFFPGYHMNKKHWLTVVLNGGIPTDAIKRLVDSSYELAAKKQR